MRDGGRVGIRNNRRREGMDERGMEGGRERVKENERAGVWEKELEGGNK